MARSKKASRKTVRGYDKEPMRRKMKLVTEEYEYELPFNYPNVTVDRRHYAGSEFHGMELNPLNSVAGRDKTEPPDVIIVEEPHPIVRMVVIGSACTPPGYVQIECEPIKGWRRADEIEEVMPVRMRADGLWGMHLRWDQWYSRTGEVRPALLTEKPYPGLPKKIFEGYPDLEGGSLKVNAIKEFPLAGMSCAVFEIPPSRKVIVTGGCAIPGWSNDTSPNDAHYSFRIIRTTVQLNRKG